MKRVLITGKNSYIGNSIKEYLMKYSGEFSVTTISLRNELWKEVNFTQYDVVYHVVGIAHRKETDVDRLHLIGQ